MHIIPAIIPQSLEDLEEHLSLVKGLVPLVQIDVCDGKFVPSTSWPYFKGGYSDDFKAILAEKDGLPLWKDFDFEIDLMVSNPFEVVSDWVSAGASAVIIHVESVSSEKLQSELTSLRRTFGKGDSQGVNVSIGLALNPGTPNDAILSFLEDIDFVQFMGIRKIGYQGQSLDEEVFDKIQTFHNAHPEISIAVDGGVNLENAERLLKEGADRLVAGSSIFESDNLIETLGEFKNLA